MDAPCIDDVACATVMSSSIPLLFTDHVYKVKENHEIYLRIWPSTGSTPKAPSPILIWIHGGAFINGSRTTTAPWALNGFHEKGYTVVSVDYRLLPQVQLKDMVEDVLDAYQWIRANINTVVAPEFVDIDRIAVAGESAGGTLVTLLGLWAKPAPKAVLNLYGVVDFTDPPFLHAPNHGAILPYSNRYTESELAAKLASPDPADVLSHCPIPPTDPRYGQLELPRGFEYTDRHWLQMDLKAYIYRHGGMVQEVFGFNDRPVEGERYAQLVKAAKEFSVLNLLAEATSFPPTYVVHGTEDAQVRVDQSDRFVKALEDKGVPVKYAREEGGIHGNDDAWDAKTVPDWKEQIQAVLEFIDFHVRA